MKTKSKVKFKIGASFLFLVFASVLMKNTVLLINYMFALILHELAHIFVATKCGYNLKEFKIGAFGVSVELDEQVQNQDAFSINLAGPMMNLMLCVFCLAICFIMPQIYPYLSAFCLSNIVLAVFNLLPVYPLDGGKIFAGIIKDEKKFNVINNVIKISFSLIFLIMFLISGLKKFNWFYLLISVFFMLCKGKVKPSFSLFKHRKHKRIDKVELIKVDENITLIELLKLIKTSKYTIFFCPTFNIKYIDEDKVLEISLKYPLTHKLKQINIDN